MPAEGHITYRYRHSKPNYLPTLAKQQSSKFATILQPTFKHSLSLPTLSHIFFYSDYPRFIKMSTAVRPVSSTTTTTTNDVPYNSHLELEEEQQDETSNFISDDAGETEDDDDDSKLESDRELDLGPQFTLKEQLEKDKDDESLTKWKEQLLGSVDISSVGESKDPEVKIQSLTITSSDRPDLVLPIPFTNDPKKSLFILKEGSQCRMKFTFTVSNNIVSGLKYTNIVWKTGVRVDSRKKMLGTFSPQQEPYTYELEEETTPSGIFARGSYAARTKFVDDDQKCYLDVSYYFEIQRNWGTPN